MAIWEKCPEHGKRMTPSHRIKSHAKKLEDKLDVLIQALSAGAEDKEIEEMAANVPLPPGTIVGRGTGAPYKIRWKSKREFEAVCEAQGAMVDWTPQESSGMQPQVTVHGLKYRWQWEKPIRVPAIVRDIFDQARQARRTANERKQEDDLPVNLVGVGPLEPAEYSSPLSG